MGGLGGGLGGTVGEFIAPGLSPALQSIVGSGVVGGVSGLATGDGFLKGAGKGVVGGSVGQLAGGVAGLTPFEQSVNSAGTSFGNAITTGYDPKTAAQVAIASGLSKGFQVGTAKPSDAVVNDLKTSDAKTAPLAYGTTVKTAEPGFFDKVFKGGPLDTTSTTTPGAKTEGSLGTKVLSGLSLISALQKPPVAAQEAIRKLSPEQQEYFNRPSVSWDWNKMQTDANAANMSLDQFMASNWPRITGYASGNPGAQQGAYNYPQAPVGKAQGGALSAVARFAQGAGSGRADTIDAKLSDGEYVIDAETVAMLGDGSNKEGAKRLDAMRQNIRSHKGKNLAKGKISPNAKSALAYLKEFA